MREIGSSSTIAECYRPFSPSSLTALGQTRPITALYHRYITAQVDIAKVTPGIVKKAMDTLRKHPTLRAFLMECTELPPYSDAVRHATKLPVYDAVTACDFFLSGRQDNKRFGVNDCALPCSCLPETDDVL